MQGNISAGGRLGKTGEISFNPVTLVEFNERKVVCRHEGAVMGWVWRARQALKKQKSEEQSVAGKPVIMCNGFRRWPPWTER